MVVEGQPGEGERAVRSAGLLVCAPRHRGAHCGTIAEANIDTILTLTPSRTFNMLLGYVLSMSCIGKNV